MLDRNKELPEYLKRVKEDLEQCTEEELERAAESFARGMVGSERTRKEKASRAGNKYNDGGASAIIPGSKSNEMPEYLKRVKEDLEQCTKEELKKAAESFAIGMVGRRHIKEKTDK